MSRPPPVTGATRGGGASAKPPAPRAIGAALWIVLVALLAIVLVFAAIRLVTDVPLVISASPASPGSFEARYVAHPVKAYLHILPGLVYLVGAPIQLARGFRQRHWRLHRRLGRVLLGAGLVSGVFALVFGVSHPFGGTGEVAATIVFGAWFLAALSLAFRAVRRGDVRAHRRWMIRAFAMGLGVGSIRLWIGLLSGATTLTTFPGAFAPGFWLGLSSHALAAELWLKWRPDGPRDVRQRSYREGTR
jgi:uncharacterized membrane protein